MSGWIAGRSTPKRPTPRVRASDSTAAAIAGGIAPTDGWTEAPPDARSARERRRKRRHRDRWPSGATKRCRLNSPHRLCR